MKYGNGAEGERDWPQSKKTPTRLMVQSGSRCPSIPDEVIVLTRSFRNLLLGVGQ